MSLEPDRWCLPGDWPRHKLRAYGRIVRTPGGAEYRRLLNFLSKTATQGERAILDTSPVPKFAQVPSIVNRRQRSAGVHEAPRLAMQPRAQCEQAGSAMDVENLPLSITIDESVSAEALEHAHALRVNDSAARQNAASNPPATPVVPNYAIPAADAIVGRADGSDLIDAGAGANGNEATYDQFAELIARGTMQNRAGEETVASLLREPFVETIADGLDQSETVTQSEPVETIGLLEQDLNSSNNVMQVQSQSGTASAITAELIAQNPGIQNEDGQFISHLELLLNEWFDRENSEVEDTEGAPQVDSLAKRRERAYALLKGRNASKAEPERVFNQIRSVGFADSTQIRSVGFADSTQIRSVGFADSTQIRSVGFIDSTNRLNDAGSSSAAFSEPPVTRREQQRKKNRDARLQEMSHTTFPLPNGMRREVFRDGSFVIKDAVGRVNEARAQDGATMTCSYDEKGHFKSFVRSDAKGKIYTTGVKDKHGVVVRDENGSVRAQGDSMTVDSNGCVSIRKFDGQFWSLDVMRGIHIERRILEDAKGGWNSLTALLTSDGFRMVTRFQKLQESKREEFRKYGDWLASAEASKFRFYGRDGSMIQFENDEDLEALRPSRIWPAGSRPVEREWIGRRQAGTAWEAVHRYIAQYLSAL